ncbi:MAG: hypothetical protein JW740_02365, partial [Candidatus Zambryskibacteria bacterium]|nr:hypothetical protein [Candidatus Zambryskibacteria bacterium]
AVIASIVISSTNQSRARGRDAHRISQIREVQKALEMYHLAHGQYPANHLPLPINFGPEIPEQWSETLKTLNNEGLISATFVNKGIESIKEIGFNWINKAYAVAMAPYYKCSIQDPLYKTADDYKYSYGYVASADQKNYKIRIYIENKDSIIFQNSLSGTFLDGSTTGNTACDKDFNYYCIGN